jgi:hypothetical protein
VPSIFRARATITSTVGSPALITAYFQTGTAGSTAIATECVARVRACLNAMVGFVHSSANYLPDLQVAELDAGSGTLVNLWAGATPTGITWLGTADALPPATQGLLRLSTSAFVAGRRVQGRINMPFPREDGNDPGAVPSSAYRAALVAAGNALSTTITTVVTPAVWHRPKAGVGGVGCAVTSVSAATTWASLRSRRP